MHRRKPHSASGSRIVVAKTGGCESVYIHRPLSSASGSIISRRVWSGSHNIKMKKKGGGREGEGGGFHYQSGRNWGTPFDKLKKKRRREEIVCGGCDLRNALTSEWYTCIHAIHTIFSLSLSLVPVVMLYVWRSCQHLTTNRSHICMCG